MISARAQNRICNQYQVCMLSLRPRTIINYKTLVSKINAVSLQQRRSKSTIQDKLNGMQRPSFSLQELLEEITVDEDRWKHVTHNVVEHDALYHELPYSPSSYKFKEYCEQNNIYYIDYIIDSKVDKKQRLFYVKWLGYGPEYNSWEPASNIHPTLITEFGLKNGCCL